MQRHPTHGPNDRRCAAARSALDQMPVPRFSKPNDKTNALPHPQEATVKEISANADMAIQGFTNSPCLISNPSLS